MSRLIVVSNRVNPPSGRGDESVGRNRAGASCLTRIVVSKSRPAE